MLVSCVTKPFYYADFDVAAEDGTLLCDWDTHMVRGTWLSKNHNIFYYGLPPPLLELLRNARSPSSANKTLVIVVLPNFL